VRSAKLCRALGSAANGSMRARHSISAGKNGTIDLINRDNMGHFNSTDDSQIVQTLENVFPFGTPEPGNYSAPVLLQRQGLFQPVADNIQSFTLTNGLLSTASTSRSPEIYAYPGGTIALSANGTTHGILWALENAAMGRGRSERTMRQILQPNYTTRIKRAAETRWMNSRSRAHQSS
jgi:hypothetical protein